MTTIALDDRLAQLVDLHSEPEKIATGFVFTEGPLWHPREHHFTFSDVRADTMYRWTQAGGATVFRKPSGGSNGNTYDRQGRLITCEPRPHHHRVRFRRTVRDARFPGRVPQVKSVSPQKPPRRTPGGQAQMPDPTCWMYSFMWSEAARVSCNRTNCVRGSRW